MTPIAELKRRAAENLPQTLERLRSLVEIESPSDDKAAVDRANDHVAGWAEAAGATVKRHPQKAHGDVLELRFGPARVGSGSGRGRVLLLGHLDTVWPLGTLAAMTWREADGKIFGPGTVDMKAGVVMALEALRLLAEAGELKRPVTLLLASDEEIGSPVSRPITERIAKESVAALVLEPAQGLAYKTARKGVGHFDLHVRGVGAHAGVDFAAGHSAVLTMARLIQEVSAWTDLSRGITVNAGVVRGGTKSNVVAAECVCEVDVRIVRQSQARAIEAKFRKLRPVDKGCTLEVRGGFNRPPMERTPGTVRLLRQAQSLARELGFELEEAATGGGSDGNFTSAVGCATLDGMGAIGAGAHAAHEHIMPAPMAERIAMLAAMILAAE